MSLGRALWSRLGALFLVIGIVLSPLRATAAAIPVLVASVSANESTTTTPLGRPDPVRRGTYAAPVGYDDSTDFREITGAHRWTRENRNRVAVASRCRIARPPGP